MHDTIEMDSLTRAKKQVEVRQIEAEVGSLMFKKRDLEMELKAVNQQLEGLIKQRDALK